MQLDCSELQRMRIDRHCSADLHYRDMASSAARLLKVPCVRLVPVAWCAARLQGAHVYGSTAFGLGRSLTARGFPSAVDVGLFVCISTAERGGFSNTACW